MKRHLASSFATEGDASLSKPTLGLLVGGTLGLMDGLSDFLYPSLALMMTSAIPFSLLKGLAAGVVIGYVAQRLHSFMSGHTRRHTAQILEVKADLNFPKQ